MRKKILWWISVLLWMGVIFWFSSQPNLKSALPSLWDTIFRKIAHISEYFVLAYLFLRAFSQSVFHYKKVLLVTLMFGLLVASVDEWYQTTVVGRTGAVTDVFIDSIGVFICIVLLNFYKKSYVSRH